MAKKQIPLTVELFFQEIMPRIEEILDEKINAYRKDVVKYREEVRLLRQEIKTFPEQVKTYREELKMYREELVGFKIEVMGEIRALRKEVGIGGS